jgi:hypothetical protein
MPAMSPANSWRVQDGRRVNTPLPLARQTASRTAASTVAQTLSHPPLEAGLRQQLGRPAEQHGAEGKAQRAATTGAESAG